MNYVFRMVDRLLRSCAHDILCWRRGLSAWKAARKEFLASTRKTPERLNRDVELRLRAILVHAYETSPYYRDLWDSIGFWPSSSFQVDELQRLPFLTKDIIREHKATLASTQFHPDELDLDTTSGTTTGTRTAFYRDHACSVNRMGRQWGMLELCGYRPGTRRALVWGVHTDLSSTSNFNRSFKQWFQDYGAGQETLCCTVVSEEAMRDYHHRLRRFQPKILYGYPKAMTQLAEFIQQQKLEPIKVKTIITTAERLIDSQRDFLQQAYGGEVFNLYCTREYGCIGFECKQHQGLHLDTESVLVEVINREQPVEPGESGEIVITDLLNYGMPLIRSRTGDMGTLGTEPCECGSPLPVLKALEGRTSDYLYRPDGSRVAGIMLETLFMEIPAILQAQFVQESMHELDVLLVIAGEFTDEIRKAAIRQLRGMMGWEIAINIHCVADIARNLQSGKLQVVICKIGCQERLTVA